MEENLFRAYQLLNVVNVSGYQNVLALGEAIRLIDDVMRNMAKQKTDEEEKKKLDELNSQKP